jgi:AraC-like DNA-binding protein
VSVAIPLVRVAGLKMATAFAERVGAPVDRLLEKAKLSPDLLEQPETLVPFLAVTRFVEELARAEKIEDLGLRIGTAAPPLPPGTFGRLIGQSLTLQDALETLCRLWSSFNSSVDVWLTRSADQVHLHYRFLHGTERDWHHFAAASLMQFLNFVRSVAGPGWRPTAIQLPMHELPGSRAVPLLADTPITFGQPAATITFSAALLHRPLPWAPPVTTSAEVAVWERAKPPADVGGAVRQVITTMLPVGYPDVHLVAEAVRMSARTLQRRLHAEGLTFRRMVAQARFDEARRLLGDPARKVIDVALDLGYSDPSHMSRAFVRWTGHVPREFRRLLVASHPDAAGS